MSKKCKECRAVIDQPKNATYCRKFCDKKCYGAHLQSKLSNGTSDTHPWDKLKTCTNAMMVLYTIVMGIALYTQPVAWGAVGFYILSLVLFGIYVYLRDI